MKTTYGLVVLAIGLTGCDHLATAVRARARLQVELDAKTRLTLWVEGADSHLAGVPQSAPGEPIHRVFEGKDGAVLFAYDLEVGKRGADGSYHFLLKPSQQKPTFAVARDVVITPPNLLRVELLERPGTDDKVVDVFSLQQRTADDQTRNNPMNHMQKVHNFMFRLFH